MMTIEDVKNKLKSLNKLKELKPEEYAIENGIAYTIANQKGDMKFTQLRKFFGHIKKIESVKVKGKKDSEPIAKADLYMLMPELAYGVGRKVISKEFYEIMKICLCEGKITTVADFKRFVDLLAAVIAYHKMSK